MKLCHRSSSDLLLHLAPLLLLVLCDQPRVAAGAAAPSSALPSYLPGSFLMPWSIDVMSVSLFNATSGNNFTTYFGANLSAGSFIVYPQERLIVMEVDLPPMGYQFFVLEYAPNTAPWPSKRFPWCTSPDNAFMTPFYLNGHFYATKYWQTVYRITFPSIVGADCVMTPTSLTLPMSTLGLSTSLGQSNSVTWISKKAVMQLSADYEGIPFVTLYATHPLKTLHPL